MQNIRYLNMFTAAALCVFGAACAKKQVAVAKPAPPPVAQSTPAPQAAATPAPQPRREQPSQPVAQVTPNRYPDAATRARIDELIGRIQDAYFDYNEHSLREDAISTLKGDSKELAEILSRFPEYRLKIEGYCDERGSTEYNLALGDARAKAAKEYLVNSGVSGAQLDTVSYGKENPVCTDHDEVCWQKNRRVHIVAEKNNS